MIRKLKGLVAGRPDAARVRLALSDVIRHGRVDSPRTTFDKFMGHVKRLGSERAWSIARATLAPARAREIDALVAAKEAAIRDAIRSTSGAQRRRRAAPARSKSTGARRASSRPGAA